MSLFTLSKAGVKLHEGMLLEGLRAPGLAISRALGCCVAKYVVDRLFQLGEPLSDTSY